MTFTQTPIVFLKNSMGVFVKHMHNSFLVCEKNSVFVLKNGVLRAENGGLRVEKRRFTKIKPRFST